MNGDEKKHKGKSGAKKKVKVAPSVRFYADTDHTGTVNESQAEWDARKKNLGAVVVFNCDRGGAAAPRIDCEDTDIKNAGELRDFGKLVVKKNAGLPADYRAYVILSPTDALKVRLFDDFTAGAKAVAGAVPSGPLGLVPVTTQYEIKDIRKKDRTFAVEAVEPSRKKGHDTVRVNVALKKKGAVKFTSYVNFTIAPWLMLSNVEEVAEAYVAETGDNAAFVASLNGILGGKLNVIKPNPAPLDRWMQDIMEIGISSTPATVANPMHQFINSCNADPPGRASRGELFDQVKRTVIADKFGHIEMPQHGFKSLDSFGNLEVTPPLDKHPYGRIFYGIRDTAYSPGHAADEMSAEVTSLLDANIHQPPVKIPTNWLAVGHVDEFLSFVPDLKAKGGQKPYKLLQASPRVAIALCEKLKKAGRGSAKICAGKGIDYEITVDDFLSDVDGLLTLNRAVNKLLSRIRRTIIRKRFDLPYVKGKDDIIGLPVIFNGTLLGMGKVEDAIARTGGMVNCLVAKPDVIVPKPFGPKDAAGTDVFEDYARKKLEALGLNFHPVDDWDTYHVLMGEIHCGTNAKRVPPSDWKWWE